MTKKAKDKTRSIGQDHRINRILFKKQRKYFKKHEGLKMWTAILINHSRLLCFYIL